MEVLSRLTIKIGPEELREAMPLALRFHSEPGIYTHWKLQRTCQSWTERLLEAADEGQIIDWLPDMIRSMIPEEGTVSNRLHRWKDPVADVPFRLTESVGSDQNDNTSIQEAIEWLLNLARGASGETWRRSVLRLMSIHRLEVMTSDQEAETGSILWKHPAKDGFPDLPDVGRVYFLYWPAPAQINVVEKLRTHLLGATPQKSVTDARGGRITVRATQHTDAVIDSIARASIPIVQIPNESEGFVNWSNEDTKILWTKVIEWWHNDKRALHLEQFSRGIAGGSRADEQLAGLFATAWNAGMFLRRAVLPAMQETNEEDWEDILAFLQDTRRHEVYLTTAWPYVLIHRSSETQRVGRMISDDLSSDVKGAVEAGAHAVRHWIHLADAGLAERPPKQAVDALLHRVVFRRRIGAEECLRQLTLLLAEQPRFFGLCDVDLMVASLTPWSESIRLPVQDGQDGDFPENERPDLRVQLGGLAAALSEWIRNKFPGRPEPRPIADLRAQYASDPLPEVRRSFDARS